ncbi:flagellar hook-basal body protein [Desulfovibrio sp. X2]|uniref:flagellar hook protein FlgE n=1 Tax=Desulfovibrio sp. X2 TaxID=941449 RepID=UPI000358E435|nr:flagellar hook protein FlgE [Desulfovibrio sp. X2]EPR41623.1 flagellar hook-basal body protein [Desulfovibrio sp. X2]
MSLTGSLYAGISGLQAHSQKMSVIGNNLANTSTIGFKSSTMQFEDIFYQSVNTGAGIGQVGVGAGVAAIYSNFAQGSYESTSEATDVAIGGTGFFMVNNPNTDEMYYTRAGEFRFDNSGYLVDTNGYRVQGWQVKDGSSSGTVQTTGVSGDIQLKNFQSPPEATSTVSMLLNLDSSSDDDSANAANPFFSLFGNWDGTDSDTPIADSRYAYQNTITVYDENGSAQTLTVYCDPVKDASVVSNSGGNLQWEFIVACDPSEDGRTIGGQKVGSTSAAGLLMTGTLTFNAAGQLTGMSAYTLASGASGDLKDLSNWTTADLNDDGLPTFTANFTGEADASATGEANASAIAIDFGIHDSGSPTSWSGSASNASMVGNNPSMLDNFTSPKISALTTTSYDSSSTTISQSQDGYGPGFLTDISVNRDGVITGTYSNGQVLDLYVLTLASFTNPYGLSREGDNLFSATRESGAAVTGTANTGQLGSISSNTLEQSNVDTATEMVDLITTQRGFEANSKVITTADSMLSELIQLKR